MVAAVAADEVRLLLQVLVRVELLLFEVIVEKRELLVLLLWWRLVVIVPLRSFMGEFVKLDGVDLDLAGE